jgi:hypothetical protein
LDEITKELRGNLDEAGTEESDLEAGTDDGDAFRTRKRDDGLHELDEHAPFMAGRERGASDGRGPSPCQLGTIEMRADPKAAPVSLVEHGKRGLDVRAGQAQLNMQAFQLLARDGHLETVDGPTAQGRHPTHRA